MIQKIGKWFLGGIIIAFVIWIGLSIYANFAVFNQTTLSSVYPDASEAMYAVHILNTGNLIFTNSYEYRDQKYTLHGYWETYKAGFIYRKADITLDERIFGTINVKPR